MHVAALGVWLGVVLMSGAAAAIIFPTVKALAPSVPAYAGYAGEHWMLVAGRVAQRVFLAGDVAQFACACGAGLGLLFARPFGHVWWRRVATALRLTLLCGAVTALAYQLFVLAPRMNANLHGYWDAAAAGDTATAEALRAAFSAEHPTATRVLGVIAALVSACLALAAWPERNGATGDAAAAMPPARRTGSGLEEPRLLRERA